MMKDGHSVLLCRAPHPRGLRGDSRFEGRLCGKRLQVVPFAVRPTYRAIRDWEDVHPGCMVVRCLARDCRAFTEYEIVKERAADEQDALGVLSPESMVGRPAAGIRKSRIRR